MMAALVSHTVENRPNSCSKCFYFCCDCGEKTRQPRQGRRRVEAPADIESAFKKIASAYQTAVVCHENDTHINLSFDATSRFEESRPTKRRRNSYNTGLKSRHNQEIYPRDTHAAGDLSYGNCDGHLKRSAGNWSTEATASTVTTGSSRFGSEPGTRRPRKRRRDATEDGNSGSDDDDWERPRRRREPSVDSPKDARRSLACPFRKSDPLKHKAHSCRAEYQNTARLKQHLYRTHMKPIHCLRCGAIFSRADGLVAHSQSERSCERRDTAHMEGLDQAQVTQLKSRRAMSGKSEEEKWREMYRVIFPDASSIPSPYVEESLSEQLENLVKNELPKALEDAFEEVFEDFDARGFGPIRSRLTRSIPGIIDRIARNMRLPADILPSESANQTPSTFSSNAGQTIDQTDVQLASLSKAQSGQNDQSNSPKRAVQNSFYVNSPPSPITYVTPLVPPHYYPGEPADGRLSPAYCSWPTFTNENAPTPVSIPHWPTRIYFSPQPQESNPFSFPLNDSDPT